MVKRSLTGSLAPLNDRQVQRLVILSGGQTGVDRGALDAALEVGVECGGWCPDGRTAEDGRIPDRYPLVELEGAGYAERTRRNVEDSDGTLILCVGAPVGGTALTLELCGVLSKPVCLIDARSHRAPRGGFRPARGQPCHAYARDVVRSLCSGAG